METGTYKTLSAASEEILYKEKNSKFFGYSFHVTNEEDIKLRLEALRKQHPAAVHFCYAYRIGTEVMQYRVNDDGEPSNTAGMPIYGQIQSFGLTNVLVVVVRFFGGVKLGVGGLIAAYRTAAQMSLENADIEEKTIDLHFILSFGYKNINKVMRIIREKKLQLISQKMELDCQIEIAAKKSDAEKIQALFGAIFGVGIERK